VRDVTVTTFFSKNRKWIGYTVYCVVVTGVFLYVLFPSDAIRDYLQMRAQDLTPPLMVSVDRIKPWPPYSLRCGQTKVSFLDRPKEMLFTANSVVVRPVPTSLLKGNWAWCFNCKAYGGAVTGCTDYEMTDRDGRFRTKIEFEAIRIGKHEHLRNLVGRSVDGILNGTVSYSGTRESPLNGAGEASLELVDGKIELLSPILTLESVEYNELTIGMALKGDMLNLMRFELEGPLLKGSLSGTIRLRKELQESRLDLKGRIEPFAAFFEKAEGAEGILKFLRRKLRKGTLPFSIRGTLEKPTLTFM
jgi:type II secretion system protein N